MGTTFDEALSEAGLVDVGGRIVETPEAPEAPWMENTEVVHDYWRDVLSVRTINALCNAGLRIARDVFAKSDDELSRVRCLGPKGIAQIREAQRRVNGAPVSEWSADALASLLAAFADDHPQRQVGDAIQEAARRLRAALHALEAEPWPELN
jgi:hypothetical protein